MISRDQFFDKILPVCLVAFLLTTHLIVALGTELSHDEAYYWLYSKNLDWGYFDHPPMVAWLIKITSWLGGEIGVRLSFILGLVGSGYLLQTVILKENRWILWLGLNIFPLISFSGVFALPDGALLIFSALWIVALKLSLDQQGFRGALLVAVATACLFYSKYHGIFYVLATIIAVPQILGRKYFWISALLALALYSPHLYWQWSHDFATFRYHFIERPKIEMGFRQPAEFLAVNFILIGTLVAPYLWREFFRKVAQSSFERSLKSMTIVIVVFFFYSTLSKKMEANWTVAAGLSLLVFICLKPNNFKRNKIFQVLASLSLLLVFTAKLGLVSPGLLPIKRIGEFHGWEKWAKDIEQNNKGCTIAANRYQYASKLSFYLGKDVTALNVSSRKNQFDFWDRSYLKGQTLCWVAEQEIFPGETILTPTGQKLTLVKGVPFELIMSYKGI
ncbi:MAG: glycosyltransferase family 39 protein [Proteobacteria bacterium]|jgi:hypothetical protein|nr:glycosyltransferase family 39 protein [Pseudomonadota bacterium]